MADQCIVCLDDLDGVPDATATIDLQDAGGAVAATPSTTTNTTFTTPHPGKINNAQEIALIKPCGHILHDECLRMWSQKANSCPICRHTFNLVEVLDKVGGMFPCFGIRFCICIRTLPLHIFSVICFHGLLSLIYCLGVNLQHSQWLKQFIILRTNPPGTP